MAFFLPVLLFAGAAGISLFASGCANPSSSSSRPKPPPSAVPPDYPKSALDLTNDAGPEENGYDLLLRRFEEKSLKSKGLPFSVDSLLKKEGDGLKISDLFKDPAQAKLAIKFSRHVATHDEK